MAMCIVMNFPGSKLSDVEPVFKELTAPGRPKGIATQVVGESSEGVTIITLWDTPDAQSFYQEKVKPKLEKSGLRHVPNVLEVKHHYQRV